LNREPWNFEPELLREKQIKKWGGPWKLRLIEEKNAEWRYLHNEAVDQTRKGVSQYRLTP
jgi:hypothetical protein